MNTSDDKVGASSARAQSFLGKISKRHEGVWEQVDDVRRLAKELDVKWDRRCFVPTHFLQSEFEDPFPTRGRYKRPPALEQKKRLRDIYTITGLASWRLTRGIYLLSEIDIADSKENGLPVDADPRMFLNFPQPCIYVPTPGLTWLADPLDGFFAYLNPSRSGDELDVVLLMDRVEPFFHSLTDVIQVRIEYRIHKMREPMRSRDDIVHNWAVAVRDWSRSERDRNLFQATALGEYWKSPREPGENAVNPEELFDRLQVCLETDIRPIAALLYRVCSVTSEAPPAGLPPRPKPTKTSEGYRMVPAKEITAWEVDTRSRKLRQSTGGSVGNDQKITGGVGPQKRTHTRSAHFRNLRNGGKTRIPAAIIRPDALAPDDRPVTVITVEPNQKS